jgi:hypothetical protein
MTPCDELTVAFLKLWRQLDDDTKDRIEAELRPAAEGGAR